MTGKEQEKIIEVLLREARSELQQKMNYWKKRCGIILSSYICMIFCSILFFYYCKNWFVSFDLLISVLFATLTIVHILMLYQAVRHQNMYMKSKTECFNTFFILNKLHYLKNQINRKNRTENENLKNRVEQLNYHLSYLRARIIEAGESTVDDEKIRSEE